MPGTVLGIGNTGEQGSDQRELVFQLVCCVCVCACLQDNLVIRNGQDHFR